MRPSDLVRLLGASVVTAWVVSLPSATTSPRTSTPNSVASSMRRPPHASGQLSTRTRATRPDRATPAEAATLACIRRAESHDSFWRWGYYPHGSWGDGGGAYQMEPGTQAQAAAWAHLPVSLHSAGAQFREALVLLRHVGTEPWNGDACTYQAP